MLSRLHRLRSSLLLSFLAAALTVSFLRAEDDKLPGETTPPVAAPAFLTAVTFLVHTDGENHKLAVIQGAPVIRIDAIDDGYSVLFDPATENYTGLEHTNYTYWEFSWPDVRAAVETSKRYAARLQELTSENAITDSSSATPTNTPADATGSVPDDSGYTWKAGDQHKKIAGLDCVLWTGDSSTGESVEAWCFAGPLPQVRTAMDELAAVNEPIALVPVRTLVPTLVFPIYHALIKGGVTPVAISWGGGEDKEQFTLVSTKTRKGDSRLFSVPKLYVKTTLITMDGILDQKK